MSENRDETTGQYTAAEPLLATDQLEKDMGFSKMPEAATPAPEASTIEAEAAALKASREVELPQDVVEVAYLTPTGEKIPATEVTTLNRAADDLKTYHTNLNDVAERHVSEDFRKEVLRQRADLIKAAPELTETLGLDAAETLAKAEAVEAVEQSSETNEAARAYMAEQATHEGLDPEVSKAMNHPQVREAIEKEFTQAAQTRDAYTAGLDTARMSVMATLAEVVPHLAHLPPADFEKGLQVLSQADPPAFNKAMNIINRGAQIIQAQQQAKQHEAAVQRQGFESWRAQQNEIISKTHQLTYAQKAEFADDLTKHVAKFGVTRENIVQAMESNPLMHAAAFQDLMYRGIQHIKMTEGARARPARELPPVARPGTAPAVARGDASNIRALERQLSNATTQQSQLKIAAKLLAAKRAG